MMRNCALPKDAYYPADLEKLGIDHPTWYFKYFITKNERHNIRHREAFQTAVRSIIYSRLEKIGMIKYLLSDSKVDWESPDFKKRNANPDVAVPHIPIFASKNVATSPRVLVVFGESSQDLGIFAQRIIGMDGGINAGSVISFIHHINATKIDASTGTPFSEQQTTSMKLKTTGPGKTDLIDRDTEAPAIILANTGQLRWCRSLAKAMTFTSWNAITRPSAVDECVYFDLVRNTVPGHRDISQHVDQIFTTVISNLCGKDAKIQVIAIGDSCEYVPLSLDKNWAMVGEKMQSMAFINPDFAQPESYQNDLFRTFLLQRTRGFVKDSTVPANTPLFGPSGGTQPWQKGFGYNIYSIPDESADESIFPRHFLHVLEWQSTVASNPSHAEDELTIKTFGEDGDAYGQDIDDKVKTHAEIEAEIKLRQGLLSADFWDTTDGVVEMTNKEDELRAAKKAMFKSSSLKQNTATEAEMIKADNKESEEESKGGGGPKQAAPINGEAQIETNALDRKAVADVKAVAKEVAKGSFKVHHNKTGVYFTQHTDIDDTKGDSQDATTFLAQRTTLALPSENDVGLEALPHNLTEKRVSIDLLTKAANAEDPGSKTARGEVVTDETISTAKLEQKKSISEQQGFGYHEMSLASKELGFTRFKWLSDKEAAAAERELADAEETRKKVKADEQKARQKRHNKMHKTALLNAQIDAKKVENFDQEVSATSAALPPTIDGVMKISGKVFVEQTTKSLVTDVKILDIATQTALPTTPQAEWQKILKLAQHTSMDELSDDDEERPSQIAQRLKHLSSKEDVPYMIAELDYQKRTKSYDSVNEDELLSSTLNLNMTAAKPVILFENGVQKKLADPNARHFQKYLSDAGVSPAVAPPISPSNSKTKNHNCLRTSSDISEGCRNTPLLSVGGHGAFDEGSDIFNDAEKFAMATATDYENYIACPPEKMERLPLVVQKELRTTMPEMKLSKEDKAAILQITVLSSPIKADCRNDV